MYNWLRCSLSYYTYSLLRSAIQCVRGSWSSRGRAIQTIPPVDLVAADLIKLYNKSFFYVLYVFNFLISILLLVCSLLD